MTSDNVPEIPEAELCGPDGKRADAVMIGGGLVFGHPLSGDDPMVTFNTTIVHVFHHDNSYNFSALKDTESSSMISTWTPMQGPAFVPLASTSIGQLGANLLLVLWVCAILAVGLAKVEGVDGEVSVAVHGPSLYVLVSKMLQGLLFQVMKNRYLVRMYEAVLVVHQILVS